MNMKLNPSKTYTLPILLCISVFLLAVGCKKDQIRVDQTREYRELGHVPANAYDGGWSLTLQPDGVAEVNPGGDIRYSGTYKINGKKIKVKTPQDKGSYTFEIISETELRETKNGATLALRQ
jgi:hypothetical protein